MSLLSAVGNKQIITEGLDLYYTFEDANTGTVNDQSGNNRDGDVRSGTTTGQTANGAFYIEQDSGGQGVIVDNDSYNIANEKTVQFWHYNSGRSLSDNDEWEIGFLRNRSNANNGELFGLMYGVGSVQDLGLWGLGGNYDYAMGTSFSAEWVPKNQWVNIAITYDSNRNYRAYLNTVKEPDYFSDAGTFSGSAPLNQTAGVFEIGDNGTWSGYYVRTSLLTVYNRQLSQTEIQQNYEATKDLL